MLDDPIVPSALDLDLQTAPRDLGNELLQRLDLIREHDPVFWSERSQCWILNRHADVADMFLGRLPLSHSGRIEAFSFPVLSEDDLKRIPTLVRYVPQWIINLDGERHKRIRSLLMKAFNRRIIEGLRDYARQRAHLFIEAGIGRDSIEFNEGVARPMTGHVLFKLLGMPEELFPNLRDWAIAIVEGLGAVMPSIEKLEAADRASHEMNQAVLGVLGQRRQDPRDDLLTNMLTVTDAGEKLTLDELLAQMQVIIVAGHDTTANTMTLGVEALARNPEAWAYLRDNPDKISTCIAELQRYVAMTGGQTLLCHQDFELAGKHIKAGLVVVGMVAAADCDPLRFKDADQLDMTRDNRDSLVFAPGTHFCLGHLLAKMQLGEFFTALVNRLDRVVLLDRELDFMPVFTFRGLYSLNVRFEETR